MWVFIRPRGGQDYYLLEKENTVCAEFCPIHRFDGMDQISMFPDWASNTIREFWRSQRKGGQIESHDERNALLFLHRYRSTICSHFQRIHSGPSVILDFRESDFIHGIFRDDSLHFFANIFRIVCGHGVAKPFESAV